MKHIYIFTTILFFSLININAQTVTITGSCNGSGFVDGDYSMSTIINGRPSFTNGSYIIRWTGARWEHSNIALSQLGMYNEADTPNPPASSLSPWIPVDCDPTGVFSGDGTSTTLGVAEVESQNQKIKVFPNPSSDYITISGLESSERYGIFNYLGAEILNGTIINNEKIEIKSISNGLYFMKFKDGNTIKFIKE